MAAPQDDRDRAPGAHHQPIELSLALLDALGQAGLVVVPKTPTQNMLAAGAYAGGIDSRQVAAVYAAMLSAV